MTERFTGTIEEFASVDVGRLADWLAAWPQATWRGMADPAWNDVYLFFPPIVAGLAPHFPGCGASGVGLFLLAPGQEHPPHQDEQPPRWVTRVHVPVITNPKAIAITEDGAIHMAVGKAYKFNTLATHAVRNDGATPRVHLVFDVLRNHG